VESTTMVLDCASETVEPLVALFAQCGASAQSTPQRNLGEDLLR
jgi:hypothetical protein